MPATSWTRPSRRSAAETVLADQNLADRQAFSMFRGLGLSTSEQPSAHDGEATGSAGMCLCVQVYLDLGDLTAGLSDTVLITETGAEVLTAPTAS